MSRHMDGLDALTKALAAWADGSEAAGAAASGRRIVALAGAPGSGKSHVADAMVAALNAARPGRAAVLPMDGFHYDDGLLTELGRLPFKGAPDTFDVGGLASCLRRLRARDEDHVLVPVFDRGLEISRGSARRIGREVELIVVEGNYVLLDSPPWTALAPLFDLSVRLDVPEAVLRQRLRARWEGFGLDEAGIARKLDEVDLPNGRRVLEDSRAPDWIVANRGGA